MNKPKSPWAGVVEYLDDLVRRVEALEARTIPDPSQPAESAHREHMVDAAIYAAKSIAESQVEHNSYCDRAGAYPRSHPCVRCQSDYLKRKQQEGK